MLRGFYFSQLLSSFRARYIYFFPAAAYVTRVFALGYSCPKTCTQKKTLAKVNGSDMLQETG